MAAPLFLPGQAAQGALARAVVLENNVGYVRIAGTDQNLPEEIQSALNNLAATNQLAGLVLDLRFTAGTATDGVKATEAVLEERRMPMAILVNEQTEGAAAALAEDLREADAGLIFGAATTNLQPDMLISESLSDEKKFLKTPYGVFTASETNFNASTNFLPYVDIDHTTEADLVREKTNNADWEEGYPGEDEPPAPPQKPFIRDPVLARGVDFIKGVAALHLSKK